MKPMLLILALCLANVTVSQKLFRCFFYFDKEFVSYNLKNLYLEDDPKYLEYNFTHDSTPGQIYVNVCDGVTPPDKCEEGSASKDFAIIFLYFVNDLKKLDFLLKNLLFFLHFL